MACRWYIDECSPYWIAGWVDDDGPVEIEITVNGRQVARLAANGYREDLAKVGFGDGRRSFFFPISQHLAEPSNLVTISRGELVLHSATLQPVSPELKRAAISRATSAQGSGEIADVLFVQSADPHKYRSLLEITSRSVTEYCDRHNFAYQSFLGICRGYRDWHATYNRIPLLQRVVDSGFRGWVCYLDADAYIVDLDFDLRGYLADKNDIALIAAPDFPGDLNRPYWLVNAGSLLFNLAHPVARTIIRDWAEHFGMISDEDLQNAMVWSRDVIDDQAMLQRIVRTMPGGEAHVLMLRGDANLINYNGKFIRQLLRTSGTLEERVERARIETDRVLGSPQSAAGLRDRAPAAPVAATKNLTDLANEFGSDKGTKHGHPPHRYTYLYDLVLASYRNRNINLLELGLCGGGPEVGGPVDRVVNAPSARMWLEYFPTAQVFGFDISDFSHIRHPRFTFLRGDLGSDDDLALAAAAAPGYDIIIDDASHASPHQQLAFRHLFPRLRSGGLYIIEDLHWQSPVYEHIADSLPVTAHFMISYFERGEYIPNSILSGEFMGDVRRSTWSFAWFPSYAEPAGQAKVLVIKKKN